ncbi:MAG: hypothetical protein FJW40_23465 [Acidobacteria bacterium]|nr:hypothetical protein [Acidobacteriota bacterium]
MSDFTGSFVLPLEDDSIQYNLPPGLDPAARLDARLAAGEVTLAWDGRHGYLRSILDALRVPLSSQVLVFSKTSLQINRITPSTPRALYFNDDVYVGWVQDGDVIEISAVDPVRGGMFYTVDQRRSIPPRFKRRDECLQCHASPRTAGVPGHIVRSVYPDTDGTPLLQAGSFSTDHRSPFSERWGGWYVTGTHGKQFHMGNLIATNRDKPEALDLAAGANRRTLTGLFDRSPYLTPHSDIVALTLLAYQARAHNVITRVNYETRFALSSQEGMNKALGRPANEWSESTRRRINNSVEVLLRYMLFHDEPVFNEPIRGTAGFDHDFAQAGPRDSHGRSLRDFDLEKRIFRYPMSFLVYSAAFGALPAEARDRFWERLNQVLNGTDQHADFAHLSPADRRAIREILIETMPGAPLKGTEAAYAPAAKPAPVPRTAKCCSGAGYPASPNAERISRFVSK